MRERVCQSCGMPLISPGDFGTKKDGKKSGEYCTHCFQRGRFTDEGITLQEKIEKNVEIAKSMGVPEDKAREFAESVIPKLKRWKDEAQSLLQEDEEELE